MFMSFKHLGAGKSSLSNPCSLHVCRPTELQNPSPRRLLSRFSLFTLEKSTSPRTPSTKNRDVSLHLSKVDSETAE